MADNKREPALIAKARHHVEEEGLSCRSVDGLMGWCNGTTAALVRRESWTTSYRGPGAMKSHPSSLSNRRILSARIWRAASRHMAKIEERLDALIDEPMERERDAKLMAIIVKTLADLVRLDAEREAAARQSRPGPDTEEEATDFDELRRELSHRIEGLCGEGAPAGLSGEPVAG